MKVIVITAPEPLPGEAGAIRRMLEEGLADRVHLRRPGISREGMRRLVESLPEELYPLLTLQDCQELAVEYGLGGVHLNSRCPSAPAAFGGLLSRSCHSFDELDRFRDVSDYMFLSPVFDSISKAGYRSAFQPEELAAAAASGRIDGKVYALGGVRPRLFPLLETYGFGGAALLGYAWKDISPDGLSALARELGRG